MADVVLSCLLLPFLFYTFKTTKPIIAHIILQFAANATGSPPVKVSACAKDGSQRVVRPHVHSHFQHFTDRRSVLMSIVGLMDFAFAFGFEMAERRAGTIGLPCGTPPGGPSGWGHCVCIAAYISWWRDAPIIIAAGSCLN
jgi:hypothetical protein